MLLILSKAEEVLPPMKAAQHNENKDVLDLGRRSGGCQMGGKYIRAGAGRIQACLGEERVRQRAVSQEMLLNQPLAFGFKFHIR